MIKRIISFFTLISMMLCMNNTVYADAVISEGDQTLNYIIYSDIESAVYVESNDVLQLSSDDQYDVDVVRNYIMAGGIVVVDNEAESFAATITGEPNISFQFDEKLSSNLVATLYYEYKDVIASKEIIVEGEDIQQNKNDSIARGVALARDEQNRAVDEPEDEFLIDRLTFLYSCVPYFQIDGSYNVYTVQDSSIGEDHYVIWADIYGNSGSAISSINSHYDNKYQTDHMIISMDSQTSGFERVQYDPKSTEKASSYNVNVGLTISKDFGLSLGLFNKTYEVPDIDIGAVSTSDTTVWTINYRGDAQKRTTELHPAIDWRCPDNTQEVITNSTITYQVDSWNTLPVERTIGYNLIFTPTSAIIERD